MDNTKPPFTAYIGFKKVSCSRVHLINSLWWKAEVQTSVKADILGSLLENY